MGCQQPLRLARHIFWRGILEFWTSRGVGIGGCPRDAFWQSAAGGSSGRGEASFLLALQFEARCPDADVYAIGQYERRIHVLGDVRISCSAVDGCGCYTSCADQVGISIIP